MDDVAYMDSNPGLDPFILLAPLVYLTNLVLGFDGAVYGFYCAGEFD
jgi:hypothetical protein